MNKDKRNNRCYVCSKENPKPFSFVRYTDHKLCYPVCTQIWGSSIENWVRY